MIDVANLNFAISKDLGFVLEAERKSVEELCREIGISRTTYYKISSGSSPAENKTAERIYSYIYRKGYRLNSVKEDLLKEGNDGIVLFHGSRNGLGVITAEGSRSNCDFGNGFYLSEKYEHALSFVCDSDESSVYSFRADLSELRVKRLDVGLEWMMAICFYRGSIKGFSASPKIRKIAKEVDSADIVIAPIADNRMFYIMSLFASGDIGVEAALHSLAASKLGLQYVFKSERGLANLRPIEKLYLCREEKSERQSRLIERGKEIETKLKMAKREYRDGPYIEELFR